MASISNLVVACRLVLFFHEMIAVSNFSSFMITFVVGLVLGDGSFPQQYDLHDIFYWRGVVIVTISN